MDVHASYHSQMHTGVHSHIHGLSVLTHLFLCSCHCVSGKNRTEQPAERHPLPLSSTSFLPVTIFYLSTSHSLLHCPPPTHLGVILVSPFPLSQQEVKSGMCPSICSPFSLSNERWMTRLGSLVNVSTQLIPLGETMSVHYLDTQRNSCWFRYIIQTLCSQTGISLMQG